MAISGSFNLSQATTSPSYAYKCWYNYNYGGNTMGISAKDMGEITQTWNTELTKWRKTAKSSHDENKYEIADDDLNTAKLNAKDTIKDETGCNGKKGGMIARTTVDVALGLTGATVAVAGKKIIQKTAEKAAEKAGTKVFQKVADKAAEKAAQKVFAKAGEKAGTEATEKVAAKAAEDAAAKATKNAGKSASCIIGCTLALAQGTLYMAKKPNKTEKEACDELQNSMTDAQASLASAQGDMEDYASNVEELTDEATAQNEDANASIEDDKTEFDMYKASYDALMEKVNSGETLTEDEQNLLKELVPLMQKLGVSIQDTSDEATDIVGTLHEEIGTYQEGYDDAAATMAEVEGVTDYAESFDSATRTMCYVEAASQGLNVASGTKSTIEATSLATSGSWAFGATAWAWAFVGMGAAGTAMSTAGVAEQIKMAGDVGTEISMRKETQSLNVDTQAMYDENIDVYDGQLQSVEDLELEIPETPETPTGENGTPVTTSSENPFGQPVAQSANGTTTGSVTRNTANNQIDDKKKDKEV